MTYFETAEFMLIDQTPDFAYKRARLRASFGSHSFWCALRCQIKQQETPPWLRLQGTRQRENYYGNFLPEAR
jgi:hypothetical protein